MSCIDMSCVDMPKKSLMVMDIIYCKSAGSGVKGQSSEAKTCCNIVYDEAQLFLMLRKLRNEN